MNKLIIVLLYLLPSMVHAGEVVLNWVAPIQNTDGTPLTDLAGFKIYMGQTLGGPYPVTIDITDPTVTTLTIPNLTEGDTYYFVSTAYNSANPVQESDFSNEAVKTIPPLVPMPPTMLTIEQTVYSISKGDDILLMSAVGTAPIGSPCDPDQYIRGINEVDKRHVVPVDKVESWFGSVRSTVVVASCE